jgi:hypothetical protein
MSRPAFHLTTPAQIRRFYLLTLAQMVHLESIGLGMTTTTAKRQALEALDLVGIGHASAAELIEGLRQLAATSAGLDVEAPTARKAPEKGATA